MTNPSTYPRDPRFIINRGSSGASITITPGETSKLVDWSFSFQENIGKKVTILYDNSDPTATVNILSSSCALWTSGTGSINLGDPIEFGLKQAGSSAYDTYFWGRVTEITPLSGGQVEIVAHDLLKRLEKVKPNYIHYADYRDSALFPILTTQDNGGIYYMDNVDDSYILTPMVFVGHATTDVKLDMRASSAGNGLSNYIDDVGDIVYQEFIATGNALVGSELHLNVTMGVEIGPLVVKCWIRRDRNGTPGAYLASAEKSYSSSGQTTWQIDWVDELGGPLLITKGARYWLSLEVIDNDTLSGGFPGLYLERSDADTAYPIQFYAYTTSVTHIDDYTLDIELDFADYVEISPENYRYDSTNGWIYIKDFDGEYTTSDTYYTEPDRGMASYYYNFDLMMDDVVEKLIRQSKIFTTDVNDNCDRQFTIFRMSGQTILEGLQSLADLYETSGNWNGYQHAFGHYDDSGTAKLKFGKRKKLSDAATYILSHGIDSANDDEKIIIGEPSVKKTSRNRPSEIILIGKGSDGYPIYVNFHDRAESGSTWEATKGMSGIYESYRPDLTTYDDVYREAKRLWDGLQRDVWEGSIQVSGHLIGFDWTTFSDTFGSGLNIELNWSPLGISGAKMHITGVVLKPSTTEIYVNNTDPLWMTPVKSIDTRTSKSEYLQAPVGYEDVTIIQTYYPGTITGTSLYLVLQDDGGTNIEDYHAILCTCTQDTDRNLKTFYAYCPIENGYGTAPVGKLVLQTTATGGTVRVTIDLDRTALSVEYDERRDKYRTNAMIIEITCQDS